MNALPSIVWTRVLLLQAAGFDVVEDVRRAVQRDREALDAVLPQKRRTKSLPDGGVEETIEEGGAPDHDVRLRAAEHIYDLADVRKRRDDDAADPTRPLAVSIILASPGNGHAHPGAALPAGGVTLHLDGDHAG